MPARPHKAKSAKRPSLRLPTRACLTTRACRPQEPFCTECRGAPSWYPAVYGREGRYPGLPRGEDRRGRVEERGASAGAVAPLLSLLDLLFGDLVRGTAPLRAAAHRREGDLAEQTGRNCRRACWSRGGGARGRAPGDRGRAGPEGRAWRVGLARDPKV